MDGHGRSGISPLSARDSLVDDQVPPLPNPKAVPHIWKYDEIKPLLLGTIFGRERDAYSSEWKICFRS
jgi:gentisate 1,2-dioxygenase